MKTLRFKVGDLARESASPIFKMRDGIYRFSTFRGLPVGPKVKERV